MSDLELKNKTEEELQSILERAYTFVTSNAQNAFAQQMKVNLVIAERTKRYFQESDRRNSFYTRIIIFLTVLSAVLSIAAMIMNIFILRR